MGFPYIFGSLPQGKLLFFWSLEPLMMWGFSLADHPIQRKKKPTDMQQDIFPEVIGSNS